MKAKDTVMKERECKLIFVKSVLFGRRQGHVNILSELETQAEISFKAGIKEMVEFCEENQMPDNPESNPYPGIIIISKAYWQAKLKEWGVT